MSITFPSEQLKPSSLEGLPNQFTRPSFEELYGFDAITDALLTEANQVILTEAREIIQFDEGSPVPPTANIYTNADGTFSYRLSDTTFLIQPVPNSTSYAITITRLSPLREVSFTTLFTSQARDLTTMGFTSGEILQARFRSADAQGSLSQFSLPIINFTF